tara:strand:- start:904 stop:1623 length:720 start_codon:yes stop_codon:yes gene_type:complete
MVLPSSGSLSYNTIRAEFGSPSSNVYLSLYYRGGPYTYAIPANANITTSSTGTIAVNDFYGADNKGPYASFSGGSHNTGGKSPVIYYGAGGPSLPGMSDTSLTIGGTGYTINRFYVYSSGTSMMITGTPNSNITSAPTWSQRNFYGYNSSGGLAFQFRTGWACGRGQQPTPIPGVTNQSPRVQATPGASWVYDAVGGYPGGTFVLYTDFYLSQTAGQPLPQFVSGSATALAQYITVKAN